MINKLKKTLIILAISLIIIPIGVFAQTVSLISAKKTHNIGDTFLVKVILNSSGKQINSLGGTISIPSNDFVVSNIETGESFISIWTEKPELKGNEINFSGGLPGGYSGGEGVIFTFVLKTISEGSSEVTLKNFKAFLNDGSGSMVDYISIVPLKIVNRNNPNIKPDIYVFKEDNLPPEVLNISVNKDTSIDNNKYFVSFFASDKESGIKNYEVIEEPWLFGYKKVWKDSKTPQVLDYQIWPTRVKVRAIDNYGNVIEEDIYVNSKNKFLLLTLLTLIIILSIGKRKIWYNKHK